MYGENCALIAISHQSAIVLASPRLVQIFGNVFDHFYSGGYCIPQLVCRAAGLLTPTLKFILFVKIYPAAVFGYAIFRVLRHVLFDGIYILLTCQNTYCAVALSSDQYESTACHCQLDINVRYRPWIQPVDATH